MEKFDALIIGSGPNGLSAAIRLAQAGLSVRVIEGHETIGGGTRSEPLTLPGFIHDRCSAIHPLGLASPFLRRLPLDKFGLTWIQPQAPLAQVMEDGAVLIEQDLNATAENLGKDARTYRKLMEPLTRDWQALMDDFLGPLFIQRPRPTLPKHPLTMARFSLSALSSAQGLVERFEGTRARAAFAGMAGHSMMPFDWLTTSAFGLMLGILAHAVGWPMAQGGSQAIANAMVAYFQSLGGEIRPGEWITSLESLPQHVPFCSI